MSNHNTPRTGACRSLGHRLRGKKGRVRSSLMGKRTNLCCRSVIGPSAYLDINEVGVPDAFARSQTYPERVTSMNMKRLLNLVHRGPNYTLGAQRIRRSNGTLVTLAMVVDTLKLTLDVGDIVDRHLCDGDIVVMNRQTTLHKESMMAFYVRIIYGTKTLRLPVLCTSPFNADFDGDEVII